MRNARIMLLAAASCLAFAAVPARADDYTDLLDILKAKGSLSAGEYRTLLAHHRHRAAHGDAAVAQDMAQHGAQHGAQDGAQDGAAPAAAASAAAAAMAAAAAEQHVREIKDMMTKTEAMIDSPDIVHAMPYKPGAGLTMKVGNVDVNVSGIVNAFYSYSAADRANAHTAIAGGLTDASGFDSSAVRNGLLPGALIISASTVQNGFDIDAVFGVYPGINSSVAGSLGANSGGNSVALGTAGADFRKTYISVGRADLGTIKLGRDIGLFGQDAILNDQTLLGVGATGGNADPANTSLGRIGYGYVYADFMPQITYISPIFAGFQGSVGIFQPLSPLNFAGGLSGNAPAHASPLIEARGTYDAKGSDWSVHLWGGFLTETEDGIVTATSTRASKTAIAGEAGGAFTYNIVGLTAYAYRGRGLGTTGLLSDGLSAAGALRDSEGGYVQGFIKATSKIKLVASYGESSLYLAPGELNPALERRNESETAGAYYAFTDWMTVLTEYTHTDSKSHGTNQSTANSIAAGAILFF